MLTPAYRYRCLLDRVVDGDTVILRVDLGFHVWMNATIRLLGWNCPELRTPEGERAKRTAQDLLGFAQSIIVETEKDKQTFARFLGRIWVDGIELGAILEARGLATKAL